MSKIKFLQSFIFVGILVFGSTVQQARADLIIGGTATFTFDEALSGASTPLNSLDAVFTGTQSRAETLSGAGDPFDSVSGSEKTITFSINGATPATIVGRPNNAATTLDYDASNVFGSWTPAGTDFGAFLSGGEQIGLQSMTRWRGDFGGSLMFGDFAIRYAPGRIDGTRSGLVLVSNIDFANATYADLANITTVATDSALNISGDLLYSNGFSLLTGDPTDVGVKFGSFQINAITAVPEPGSGLLVIGAAVLFTARRRVRRWFKAESES
jgi:hypothetical protein